MNVAIVCDEPTVVGGAELTMMEFAEFAPSDVTLVPLDDAEVVVLGNMTSFDDGLIETLRRKRRVVRYWHDLAHHDDPRLRTWVGERAVGIFTSPLHRHLHDYGLRGSGTEPRHTIPPALDADALRCNGGHREGTVALGSWANEGKGQGLLREWSDRNGPELGPVDVYGPGPFVPTGEYLNHRGVVAPADVGSVLCGYERFVHLPTAPEPFGRAVVEAWIAGCKLVINRQVGAMHYIDNDPEALWSAGEEFWQAVCGD